jgi:uncharacterized protein YndB with AHSA1/START domain
MFVLVALEGAIIDQSKGGGTMSPIVLTIEIARPPDEVFSYVTDPSRFAEWQEDAVRGRREGGGSPGLGSRFTTTRRIGRAERTTTSEITESNPPRSWAAHGVDGPIRPRMHVTVAPLGEGARSRVTIEVAFEGHGIGKLLVPLVRWLGRKDRPANCRNLKERLENRD